jgi:pSer/pThr/pTyr-binding forkhead associated (FHA) protein
MQSAQLPREVNQCSSASRPTFRRQRSRPKDDYREYLNRRRFLKRRSAVVAAGGQLARKLDLAAIGALADNKLETVPSPLTTTGEQLTSCEDITHYNNFYEFGVDKDSSLRKERRRACPRGPGP